MEKILNPQYLNNEVGSFQATKDILESTAPSTQAWIGEAGGAYNSGRHLVTDAFVMSFWSVTLQSLDELHSVSGLVNKLVHSTCKCEVYQMLISVKDYSSFVVLGLLFTDVYRTSFRASPCSANIVVNDQHLQVRIDGNLKVAAKYIGLY